MGGRPPWTLVGVVVTRRQVQTWKGRTALGRTEPFAAGRTAPEAPVQLSSWTCQPSLSGRRRRWASRLGFLSGDLGTILVASKWIYHGRARFAVETGRFGARWLDLAREEVDLARKGGVHGIEEGN